LNLNFETSNRLYAAQSVFISGRVKVGVKKLSVGHVFAKPGPLQMGHHRGKPVVYESSLAVQLVQVGLREEFWEARSSKMDRFRAAHARTCRASLC
jgi:hypothetical protein